MRRLELEGVSRRGKRQRTTTPDPAAPRAPDLVKRQFVAERPDQLWLADITYLPTYEGWLFLAVVMDVCSRKIVGWAMREDLKADLVVDALGMAVARRRPRPGLVHHSDRGSQYTSLAFGRTLRDSGLLASMGRRGDAYDNAPIESVISTIKNELVNRRRFKTRDQARLAVFDYIETFYNRAGSTARSATAHPTTTKGAKSAKPPLPLPNPKVSTETGQPQTPSAGNASQTRSSVANKPTSSTPPRKAKPKKSQNA